MGLNLGYKSYCGQLVDHYNTHVNVGKYSSLGFNLVLLGNGANHPMNAVTTFPLKSIYPTADFPTCDGRGPIEIGNDVWIGHDVKLLDNLTVHDGAIIGAGAVVTKSIPPYAIAVGVPAKVIRYRFELDQIEKLLKIKWWEWPEEKIIQAAEQGHFRDINLFISLYYTL